MNITRQKVVTLGAALLIASGVALLAWHPISAWISRQQGELQNAQTLRRTTVVAQPRLDLDDPVQIAVPRLDIELMVLPGVYKEDHTWTLDRSHAYFMTPGGVRTPTPIIYGHNIPEVFRPLAGVAAKEPLVVTDSTGKRYLFAYVSDVTVLPTDTTILQKYMPNTLLLMTCTGARFEQRRILQFLFIGMQPSTVKQGDSYGIIS